MICKGAARCNSAQLGAYLGAYDKPLSAYMSAEKNERVEVLEIRGSAFPDLDRSLRSWEAEAKGSKCKKPLWHAQLRTPDGENLSREQQIEAVNILEKHLGFQGQPRAIVIHQLDGHEHIHVAWSRMRRDDTTITLPDGTQHRQKAGKAIHISHSHHKNAAAAREIENTFGLLRVDDPDFTNHDKSKSRKKRREESKQKLNQKDFQKGKRSGIDPRDIKKEITELWQHTKTGKEFRDKLEKAGYVLAHGTSRAYVVVDRGGQIHSLARRIDGAFAADVRERLKDIDPASIPKVAHVKREKFFGRQEKEAAQTAEALNEKTSKVGASHDTDARKRAEREGKNGPEPDASDPLDARVILNSLTQQKSTFTKGDLYYEIGKRLEKEYGAASPPKVARIAESVAELDDCITLGEDRNGRDRYTSAAMLKTELGMRADSDKLASRNTHGIWAKIRDTAPSALKADDPARTKDSPPPLSEEQRRAFEYATSAGALKNIIGYAGTGKSRTMRAVNEASVAAGYRVFGFATSGMAAQSLQDGSGIQSRTIASLFYAMDKQPEQQERLDEFDRRIAAITSRKIEDLKRRFDIKTQRDQFASRMVRFDEKSILVVDEAGMVGSRDTARLLSIAEKAGAKVILVGDAEQLQAIDAGGAFRALIDRHGAVKISEVRRQKEDWAKVATKDFGDGFTEDALAAYRSRGHIHQLGGHAEARDKVIADWTASRKANPNDSHLMLAFTRDDVATLNEKARDAYEKEGRLGISESVHTDAGHRDFARGDRLYFLQNDTRLGVKNGTLGTVEKIEPNTMQNYHRITVRLDHADQKEGAARTVTFQTNEYKKFAHGYAATIHRTQGVTAHRAHILASQHMDRHAAYVSMSRHIDQADMYYSAAEFKNFDGLTRMLSRDRRKDTTLDYLDRAEKSGKPETFWERVRRIVPTAIARPVERMAEAVGFRSRLRRDAAEETADRELRRAKERLFKVPRDRPDRSRSHGLEL